MDRWRDRLRLAVSRTDKKHSVVAWEAGISPETLSRIMNGHSATRFETVVRIAHACDVTVSWLLEEPVRGVEFTGRERAILKEAGIVLLHALRRSYERPG